MVTPAFSLVMVLVQHGPCADIKIYYKSIRNFTLATGIVAPASKNALHQIEKTSEAAMWRRSQATIEHWKQ